MLRTLTVAVLACPGHVRRVGIDYAYCNMSGLDSMICGSDDCSSEYYLNDEGIEYRKPH